MNSDTQMVLRLLEEVRQEQREMREDIHAIRMQQKEHDLVVKLHEKRSTELEKIVKPVHEHVLVLNRATKVVLTLGALSGAIIAILSLVR